MTKIAGRYEITQSWAKAGMGVVFRAYDPAPMDREVAVKTLHEFSDPLALELFYKECRALKSISHPNIVEIFDMGEYEEDGHEEAVLRHAPAARADARRLIRKASHRLTVDRVVEIFAQTCRGLQAAHEHGLVHRDLKPSNIFVMADDSVKIIDFGVAHAVHARSRTTGYDKGTLLYMAPEQVQHKPVSVQSDIYSLGVTLYEALTRRQPFRGATEDEVIQAILSHIPPPASDLNPAVSHVISRVVHKAMAKQPWSSLRYGEGVRRHAAEGPAQRADRAVRSVTHAAEDPDRDQRRSRRATTSLPARLSASSRPKGTSIPRSPCCVPQIDQIARQKTIGSCSRAPERGSRKKRIRWRSRSFRKCSSSTRPTSPRSASRARSRTAAASARSRNGSSWRGSTPAITPTVTPARRCRTRWCFARRIRGRRACSRKSKPRSTNTCALRREKTDLYQAAVNAWKNGEVSQALTQMKHVLDLDQKAPDTSSPDAAGMYQSFYNKLRSEHDAIGAAYADARRQIADGDLGKALQTCQGFLAKYPGLAVFQALKFDIEEQQRQRLSAFVADVDRRVEAEPDLDAKVHIVRDAQRSRCGCGCTSARSMSDNAPAKAI